MKIAIASDHAGYEMKEAIKDVFSGQYTFIDLGTNDKDSVNYADYGKAMWHAISQGEAPFGIVICGTGIGISIAANRHAKVRAALCTNSTMARLSRQHNDANVLALGSRIIGLEVAVETMRTFLETSFEGGRHKERVASLGDVYK